MARDEKLNAMALLKRVERSLNFRFPGKAHSIKSSGFFFFLWVCRGWTRNFYYCTSVSLRVYVSWYIKFEGCVRFNGIRIFISNGRSWMFTYFYFLFSILVFYFLFSILLFCFLFSIPLFYFLFSILIFCFLFSIPLFYFLFSMLLFCFLFPMLLFYFWYWIFIIYSVYMCD